MRFNEHGFTLLEILLALVIFTLVALMMTRALHTMLNTQAQTEQTAAQLSKLQTALILLARDVEQTIDRPVITATGEPQPAFIGNRQMLTLTHMGFANLSGEALSSSLQRSRYRLVKGELLRDTWQQLDAISGALPQSRVLLTHIKSLQFRYLDQQNVFHDFWPLDENAAKSNNPLTGLFGIAFSSATKLPRAVEINLVFLNGNRLQQTYLLPQQEVPHAAH